MSHTVGRLSGWGHRLRRKSRDSDRSSDEGANPEGQEQTPHTNMFLDDHLPSEYFHQDVLKLIHELRIPGWARVDLQMAEDIEIDRISGALTNAVYRVNAPHYIKEQVKRQYAGKPYHHRLPVGLLLRVYGPQVDRLIDRQRELKTVEILTRLGIGPRLLGTFTNGRFEQYLNAKALTRLELRDPEMSLLIARRMRDLHDNVPLSPEQRNGGTFIWGNIVNWGKIAIEQISKLERQTPGITLRLFGTEDPNKFFRALQAYRNWLDEKWPRMQAPEELVFCHNDTQYGNILRFEPPRGSPLLIPQNQHRQIVVIDFEYSGPNARAVDIVNHFCEWMGDYHHPTMSYHIWRDRYPTIEEQQRFIDTYVEHGSPDFNDEAMEAEAAMLMAQARDCRPAVSACWGLWGIVQTPEKDDQEARDLYLHDNKEYELLDASGAFADGLADQGQGQAQVRAQEQEQEQEQGQEEEDVFDYVQYSAEKIQLFWDDLRELGVKFE